MSIVIVALLCAVIGAVPLLLAKKVVPVIVLAIIAFLVLWPLLYFATPSTIWPLFGLPGFFTAVVWLVAAIVVVVIDKDQGWGFLFPLIYLVALLVTWICGWPMLNSDRYVEMVGPVEERNWTQDVQPKDPRHMRMVSYSNALYNSRKAVAQAGSIGSQFHLSPSNTTLQRIGDHLTYAIPFDYAGFSKWLNTDGVPAYILVDAEDPERQPQLVELKKEERLKFMPGAFFNYDLERHLRNNGFVNDGFAQFRFEVDENHKPWWVVTTYKPTIWWSGEKVTSVATVDPVTGAITRYAVESAPEWIDRIYPSNFIEMYLGWHGKYASGWLNSWWGMANTTKPESAILIYGSENRAEWVVGMTSTNENDDSLLGLMYVDSRNGKVVYYKTNGGATDQAIREAVNNNQQVKYKHLKATDPQIYNVYGTMAAVVPLLNDSNAFQGVAIVPINNVQDVAVGTTQSEALRAYQTLIARTGQQIALDKSHDSTALTGVVDRIKADQAGSGTVYMFHINGAPRIFTASSGEYVKLPLTQPGDEVKITYIASGEDVVPVQSFDNLSLPLEKTEQQNEVERAATRKLEVEQAAVTADDLVKKIESMTPEELLKLKEVLK